MSHLITYRDALKQIAEGRTQNPGELARQVLKDVQSERIKALSAVHANAPDAIAAYAIGLEDENTVLMEEITALRDRVSG